MIYRSTLFHFPFSDRAVACFYVYITGKLLSDGSI